MKKLILETPENRYRVDMYSGIDLSIPLIFNGAQPNTYHVPGAQAHAWTEGAFTGDVRQGGSCNFEQYTLIPHCNGTHTEGIGHITFERISILDILRPEICLAALISVNPVPASETRETYTPALQASDIVITSDMLKTALEVFPLENIQALIIRTLPNTEDKKFIQYMDYPPVFFTTEAMVYLSSLALQHLLVDFPSLDRLFDEGMLSNHRHWWHLPKGAALPESPYFERTVTEMIFVPDRVKDSMYLLDIQIAPFQADASPSRPVIYPIIS